MPRPSEKDLANTVARLLFDSGLRPEYVIETLHLITALVMPENLHDMLVGDLAYEVEQADTPEKQKEFALELVRNLAREDHEQMAEQFAEQFTAAVTKRFKTKGVDHAG